MIVIGNGVIAREFKKIVNSNEIVVIASGVSNSKETDEEEFKREEFLVRDILLKFEKKKIVYFSTCSVLQTEVTPYIKHKIKMEEIIRKSGVNHYIFRLPQVIGVVNNNTLVSYIIRNAYLNNPLVIQENAVRNLIDIEDVVRIVRKIVELDDSNSGITLNVASSSYIEVQTIAKKIKYLMKSTSSIIVVPGGERYFIGVKILKRYIGERDIIFSDNYSIKLIAKYTNKIIMRFSHLWK